MPLQHQRLRPWAIAGSLFVGTACDGASPPADDGKARPTPTPPSSQGDSDGAGAKPEPPPAGASTPSIDEPPPKVGGWLVLEAPQATVPLLATAEIKLDTPPSKGDWLALRTVCALGPSTYVDFAETSIDADDLEAGKALQFEAHLFGSEYYELEPLLGDCDAWLTHRKRTDDGGAERMLMTVCRRGGVLTGDGCLPYTAPAATAALDPSKVFVSLGSVQAQREKSEDNRYRVDLVVETQVDAAVGQGWDLEADVTCTSGAESMQTRRGLAGPPLHALRVGQSARNTSYSFASRKQTLASPPDRCDVAVFAKRGSADPTHALGQWCFRKGAAIRRGTCSGPALPEPPGPRAAAARAAPATKPPSPLVIPTVATPAQLGLDVTSLTVERVDGGFEQAATAAVKIGKLRDKRPYLHFKSVCDVEGKTYVDTTLESISRDETSEGDTIEVQQELFKRGWPDKGTLGDCDHWVTFRDRFAGKLAQYRETLLATACTRGGKASSSGCPDLPLPQPAGPMSPALVDATVVSAVPKESVFGHGYSLRIFVDVTVKAPIRARWDLDMTVNCQAGSERSKQTDGFLGPDLDELRTGQWGRLSLSGAHGEEESLSVPPERCDMELLASRSYDDPPVHSLGQWCYEAGKPVRAGTCT